LKNEASTPSSGSMTNIWQLKLVLLLLLVICTTSMVFFIGNLSHLENVTGMNSYLNLFTYV